jgi:hypothetical protein
MLSFVTLICGAQGKTGAERGTVDHMLPTIVYMFLFYHLLDIPQDS